METPRHKILGQLELSALIVEWSTMWSGLMIFLLDESNPSDRGFGVTLTIVVVVANTILLICFVVQFVRAKMAEKKEEARLDALKGEKKGSLFSDGLSALRNRFGSHARDEGGVELVGFENPMKEKGIKKEVKKGNTTKNNRNKFPKHLIVTGEEEKSEKNEMKELKEKKERQKHKETKPFETIHTDAKTGRRYSYNKETNQTQWLAGDDEDDDEKGEAPQGETKNHSTKRTSFRKIVGGKDDYFVNVETGEAVWYVPEDGEEVS